MKRKITLLATLLTLTGAAICANSTALAQDTPPPAAKPAAAHEHHPEIRRAIHALGLAKADLQKADHDFGGHRVAALKACDEAIAQLKLALQYDKK